MAIMCAHESSVLLQADEGREGEGEVDSHSKLMGVPGEVLWGVTGRVRGGKRAVYVTNIIMP